MNRSLITLLTPCSLWLLLTATASAAGSQGPTIPEEDIKKIEEAAPQEAPATPRQPRKLLVFSRLTGYRHASVPWGAQALRILGQKTGAYTPVLSDDPAMFDRQRLVQFDAVVFNNNCGNPVQDPQRRKNLLEYVADGGGLVGIHCAAHIDFPDFITMLGGWSVNHPWNAGSTVTLKIEYPDHPLTKMFGGTRYDYTDEIFQFDRYSRKRQRVLISIDTQRTDMNVPGVFREDGDFGLVWIRSHGKGRVFFSAFGHQKDVYWRPVILEHYLTGIQFALGDLPMDTTPNPRQPTELQGENQ
jgi:type 1 glutamine amidotransferase